MPCRIPERKRENIKVKIAVNERVKKIANDNNVSQRAVYVYRQNMRRHGTLRPSKKPHQGRPQKITQEMQEVNMLRHPHCG
jgi:transposase